MRAQLTPAEIAFLTAPAAVDGFPANLTQALARTLAARLRLKVGLESLPATDRGALPVPRWEIDAQLSLLWLTRRLGGQRIAGSATFQPQTLLHALDAALAECWLDDAKRASLPPALAWRLDAAGVQATLAVQLPGMATDMTRWARRAIRHD